MFGIEPKVSGLNIRSARTDVIGLVNRKAVEPRRNALAHNGKDNQSE